MIPDFDPVTGHLPSGQHIATWQDMLDRFGHSPRRQRLLEGMLAALQLLKRAGCKRAYIDGSFVTDKRDPIDFDGCWEAEGVDFDVIDERLLTFDSGRMTQKAAFLGELFIADARAEPKARCSSTSSRPTATADPRVSWSSI